MASVSPARSRALLEVVERLSLPVYVIFFFTAGAGLHLDALDALWPAALLLHLAAGLSRWVATGHAPVMYAYENALSGSFFVGLIFLALARRYPVVARGLPAALAGVLLLLGNGVASPQSLEPLAPPFRSAWRSRPTCRTVERR